MGKHEQPLGVTDEWYTPGWLFEALGVVFDLDPCCGEGSPAEGFCRERYYEKGLESPWLGSVWLNPPYGARNGIHPWLQKMALHNNGIALVPNRTATEWWQEAASSSNAMLFIRKKIKFVRPDGSAGASPSTGHVLLAYGPEMEWELLRSEVVGVFARGVHAD